MLAAPHRLRTPSQYRAVLRGRGTHRAGGDLLVVHVTDRRKLADLLPHDRSEQTRVGFVVSKAVGNAVVRNRTKRRLRHLMGARLQLVPAGAGVVVRALPAAAAADSRALGAELDRLLAKATTRLTGGRR